MEDFKIKGLLEESDGVLVVCLEEENMLFCLIIKKDGIMIYLIWDLVIVVYCYDVMKVDKLLYVVGGE